MPKRQPAAAPAAADAAAKSARGAGGRAGPGSGRRVLAPSYELATLPPQPTDNGRRNSCWVPPVVAIARFWGVRCLPPTSRSSRSWPPEAGATALSADSILQLRPGDDDEEVCEVLEDVTGDFTPEVTWGNDEAFITQNLDIVWGGPTSQEDYGTRSVSDAWFAALTSTIESDNLVLLLVERLEGGRDKGNTHYLLVLGYEETVRRRGGNVRTLWLKDPMEGDQLLSAEFWAESGVELTTRQPNGRTLDRYAILEATHLRRPNAVPEGRSTKHIGGGRTQEAPNASASADNVEHVGGSGGAGPTAMEPPRT
eukprot:SAG11_NODE_440_length_9448_cov_3.356509_5_plen_311_part_00